MLEVRNLSKAFQSEQGKTAVLQNISLHMEREGLVSLLGRSGSGKTTLLRLIGGFDAPDNGEILFEGEPIQKPSPERFMVFQEYNQLFPWKSVRENITFALATARPEMPPAKRKSTTAHWLAEAGLEGDGEKWPSQLSGGMKQRAALARAFALKPALLLLDEPFAGLDAVLRKSMQKLLKNLCFRYHTAALFVTHDIDEALALSESPAVLLPDGTSICRIPANAKARAEIEALL